MEQEAHVEAQQEERIAVTLEAISQRLGELVREVAWLGTCLRVVADRMPR